MFNKTLRLTLVLLSLSTTAGKADGIPAAVATTSPIASPAAAAPQLDPAIRTILVPAGTEVPLHVVGTVSSGSSKADDIFPIQAASDIVVDGMVVVRRGAGGQGTIVNADSAGGNGHSGSLAFRIDYIYSVDGGRIRLSETVQKQVEDDHRGASSTATIIGFATFGLGGLFGHNLARGSEKTLNEKTVFTGFVADTVHVDTKLPATQTAFDK